MKKRSSTNPASRPEIKRQYYVRNMNRIKALREVALRIARSSDNDFIPELEAVAPTNCIRCLSNHRT